MIPLIVLLTAFAVFFAFTRDARKSGRFAFAIMFLLTASAHFVPGQREDLIRMVPPFIPAPAFMVTVTGVLEILGAIGLVVPRTSRIAAGALALMLLAMFPANVFAAMNGLTLMGKPATPLVLRSFIQIVFLAGLLAIAIRPARGEAKPALL
jgi:uncharacterized membrane protein